MSNPQSILSSSENMIPHPKSKKPVAIFPKSMIRCRYLNIFRIITWCITLAGIIVICMYGVEESKLLVKELDLVNARFSPIIIRIYLSSPGVQKFDQQMGQWPKGQQNYGSDTGICWLLWGKRKQVCTQLSPIDNSFAFCFYLCFSLSLSEISSFIIFCPSI